MTVIVPGTFRCPSKPPQAPRGEIAPRPTPGLCILLLWLLLFPSWLSAQNAVQPPAPDDVENTAVLEASGAAVEIDGRPIFMVYANVAGFTAQERAESIAARVVRVAARRNIPIEAIRVEDRGSWTEILAGNDRILAITEADARGADRNRADLANEYAAVIRQTVERYRVDHTWRHLLWALLYAVLTTVALVVLLKLLFTVRTRVRESITEWMQSPAKPTFDRGVGGRFKRYLLRPATVLGRGSFVVLVLALLQLYGTIVLRFFPATRYTSYQITNWLLSQISGLAKHIVNYIPNFILVIVICLATYYLMRLNEYIFGEIRDERLTIKGFYPDWAQPTAKLVRLLIAAAAGVVIFPYLPGSGSPAFKGISVFVGVLLSLGSTSAVAHAVAGSILTYMRAFQVGDFVKIGSDVGEVIERNLLVTRICTQKREIITIPNGTVLGGVVINYSAEARHQGVIFHTTVTIGYDAPWRQVHQLLISAALATQHVVREPAPFVLQTALNDFFVAYEINAYTAKPTLMQEIYSDLHQNIQDKFNEAGVEINSPHYTALRDGNHTTTPGEYLEAKYQAPSFKLEQVNDGENTPSRGTAKAAQKG